MKIAFVAMSGVRVRTDALRELGVTLPGFVQRGKVIASLPSLGLLTLAGHTPHHHTLSYHEIDALDAAAVPDVDLVAISSFTARIDAAYTFAAHCRAAGRTVVLGGLHVSACPEESLQHADAIVTGAGERAWPELLADFETGRLRRVYHGTAGNVFTSAYAPPRFDLLRGLSHNRITVQTTRGCPRDCAFCAASLRLGGAYQRKPVERVISEIRAAKKIANNPFFEFADDNTFLDRAWSRELLRALAREDIHYFTETDASLADDPELCSLLASSGCRQVLLGFESPHSADLDGIDPAHWKRSQAPHIRRVIDTLQSRGVSVNGCFILGLDHHTPAVFPDLLRFVRESGLADVQFTVLTPFPGTPLFAQLKRENRLLRERFWDRCTLFDVNFLPKRMRVEELEAGMRWLFSEAYSGPAVRARRRAFLRAPALSRSDSRADAAAAPARAKASRNGPRPADTPPAR